MTNLHYKIILNNNVEYVFDKLFEKTIYEEWSKVFSTGSRMSGLLAIGEEIGFYDGDGNGMIATVSKYEINKVVEFRYLAELMDGKRTPYEDDSNFERYTFTNLQDQMVMLDIELNIPDEYRDLFEELWEKAIVEIQDIFDNDDEDSIA